MPRLGSLSAVLLPRRPGFDTRLLPARTVVDRTTHLDGVFSLYVALPLATCAASPCTC